MTIEPDTSKPRNRISTPPSTSCWAADSTSTSDDRLERELDRILDGINGLELAALQQGDGFAEQKSEPAPIDEANELTPTVDQTSRPKPKPRSNPPTPICP